MFLLPLNNERREGASWGQWRALVVDRGDFELELFKAMPNVQNNSIGVEVE